MNVQSLVLELLANFVFQAVMTVVQATVVLCVVVLFLWTVWTVVSMTLGRNGSEAVDSA